MTQIDPAAVINELALRIANLSVENAQLKAALSATMDKEAVTSGNPEDDSRTFPN